MNWRRIIIVGIALAIAALVIMSFGGITIDLGGLSKFMPAAVVLILIVLLVNTWYQIDILKELRSFRNQEDDQ